MYRGVDSLQRTPHYDVRYCIYTCIYTHEKWFHIAILAKQTYEKLTQQAYIG